jgi:hypothetical protein
VDALETKRIYRTEHNGLTHVTLRQLIGGIEVFQGGLEIHVAGDGRVVAALGEVFANLTSAVPNQKRLGAGEALRLAASTIGIDDVGPVSSNGAVSTADERHEITNSSESPFSRDVPARLVYFPLSPKQVRLAWELVLWMRSSADVYYVIVDADRGSLLFRYNLTSYDENPLKPHGLVFTSESPRPESPYVNNDAPAEVPRQDIAFHADGFNGKQTFAPSDPHYDWWAGGSAAGLISNNADARLDRDADNQPDLPRLTADDGNYSFPIDFSIAPTTTNNQKAAVTNLFYWVNRYHDIIHQFGFNEAAGNFQRDNFNLGGSANDPVIADAQDGSGSNNANFSAPPDGSSGRVQMFLWTGTPQLDGDLDQGVILHELTHGVSSRLVGNSTGLTGTQARGMGEGWSDFLSLTLLRSEGDAINGQYLVGQYVRNNYARGIRRYPYSTDLSVNPLTFGNISLNAEVHAVGEIWCNTLWEMRAQLVQKYGFTEGQRQSIQLVIDGLKLTPAGPTFVDARDAILLADRVDNGGSNQCILWQAFAKRGLGYTARAADSNDVAPVESFVTPPYCSDTGSLQLEKQNYVANENVNITLGDKNASSPVSVRISTTKSGDQEVVALSPNPGFPGSFTGTIKFRAGQAAGGDGMLEGSVEAGDEILVTYDDAATATGGPAQATARAGVGREKAVISDDVESGNQGWSAGGFWAIVKTSDSSVGHAWTDSPAGDYLNNSDTALTSKLIDLSGLTDIALTIAHRYDFEEGFDYGMVEFSTDDGESWSRAAAFTGLTTSFDQARIPLPALAGQSRARVRFRVVSDPAITRDGWIIDDIRILGRASSPGIQGEGPAALGSVQPAFGSPNGGTQVLISGENFTDRADTLVEFGGVPASSFKVLGEKTIVATTPPHNAGPVAVSVSNRNGAAILPEGFTYYSGQEPAPLLVSSIYPTQGSTRGGTQITIVGSNFTPSTIVTFDAQSAATVFVNSRKLIAISPPSPGGAPTTSKLSVTNGTFGVLTQYTYTAPTPPQVAVVSPTDGQQIFAGSTVIISWQSSDDRALAGHRIALDFVVPSQGQLTQIISSDVRGDARSFVWNVPLTQATTNQARVRITAIDDEGAESEATSPGFFTIVKRWESLSSPLPTPLQRLQVASDGKVLYAVGGRRTGSSSTSVSTLQSLDPASALPVWNQNLAPLPSPLNGGQAVVIDGKLYLPGGLNSNAAISTQHFVYDIAGNA